ncbi:MAG: hypothetical protein WC371_03785, partial [Parachlamydiales bacterium]
MPQETPPVGPAASASPQKQLVGQITIQAQGGQKTLNIYWEGQKLSEYLSKENIQTLAQKHFELLLAQYPGFQPSQTKLDVEYEWAGREIKLLSATLNAPKKPPQTISPGPSARSGPPKSTGPHDLSAVVEEETTPPERGHFEVIQELVRAI